MNLGTFMTGGEERHLSVVRGWFPLLLERSAQFTALCHWIQSDPNDHLNLSLTRAGSAVTPIFLFIKSSQLSHNFSLLLMENLSVEFMVSFGPSLHWERSRAHWWDGGKPFLNFLILSGLGQWINMSAFDLPHQSGGTNESRGTFECKLTWVIFTGKGLRLNEASFEEYSVKAVWFRGVWFLLCWSFTSTLLYSKRFINL